MKELMPEWKALFDGRVSLNAEKAVQKTIDVLNGQ